MTFGSNIEKGIKDAGLDKEVEKLEDKVLPAEVLEMITATYYKLEPHLVDLEWWGIYCDDDQVLEEVLIFYQQLEEAYPASRFPHAWIDANGKILHYPHRYLPHMLEGIVSCTKRWKAFSAAEKQVTIEHCRKSELSLWWGFGESHPSNCTLEQYDRLSILVETWDGTRPELVKILKEAGIKPDIARYPTFNFFA